MKITILIPTFNSEKFILISLNELINAIKKLKEQFQLIIIDDGSSDSTYDVLLNFKKNIKNKNIFNFTLIKNSKNYGQHVANFIGMKYSQGDYLLTMDDDLQNNPSDIIKLIEFSKKNPEIEIVYGNFEQKKHRLYRIIGSKIINKLLVNIFNIEKKDLKITNFRLIKNNVVKKIIQDNSYRPYVPGLALKYSIKHANVLVIHHEKKFGKSNYTISKLFGLVWYLLFFHSTLPLRFITIFGLISSLIIFLVASFTTIKAIFYGNVIPGWASIVTLISISNIIIIIFLIILSEYFITLLRQINTKNIIYDFNVDE